MEDERHLADIQLNSERDPQRQRAKELFGQLAQKYGEEALLEHIGKQTDNNVTVFSDWLRGAGAHSPSEGIRIRILELLKYFQPGDLPEPQHVSRSVVDPDASKRHPGRLTPEAEKRNVRAAKTDAETRKALQRFRDREKH